MSTPDRQTDREKEGEEGKQHASINFLRHLLQHYGADLPIVQKRMIAHTDKPLIQQYDLTCTTTAIKTTKQQVQTT